MIDSVNAHDVRPRLGSYAVVRDGSLPAAEHRVTLDKCRPINQDACLVLFALNICGEVLCRNQDIRVAELWLLPSQAFDSDQPIPNVGDYIDHGLKIVDGLARQWRLVT